MIQPRNLARKANANWVLYDESGNAILTLDKTTKAATFSGALTVDGATTLTGAQTFTGQPTFAAAALFFAGTVALPGMAFSADPDTGIYRIGANNLGVGVNGAKVLDVGTGGLGVTGTLTATGTGYIGDTANADVTLGLTLNQAANDDQILAFKSSDVAHGVTTLAETDTWGAFRKYVAANGGMEVVGIEDTGDTGLALTAVAVTANATRSTSGAAPIMLKAHLKSGTGLATVGADKNLLTVSDNGTVRFVLDSDGDSFQDVGTAWTNFDDHDDAQLLTDLSVAVSRDGDPIKERFGEFVRYNRAHLQKHKLVEFNEDGHHFVNMSRLSMVLVGAVRQAGEQITALRDEITQVRRMLPAR